MDALLNMFDIVIQSSLDMSLPASATLDLRGGGQAEIVWQKDRKACHAGPLST